MWNEGDAPVLSGVVGYANKQAAICECLAVKCALHWLLQLKMKGIIPGWAAEYEVLLANAQSHDSPQVIDEMDEDAKTDETLFDEDNDML